jgi:hypothetical protein
VLATRRSAERRYEKKIPRGASPVNAGSREASTNRPLDA